MMVGLRELSPALESLVLPNGMLALGGAGEKALDPAYDLFCGTSASAKSERKNLTVCDDVLFLAEAARKSDWDPKSTVSHLTSYLPEPNPYSETAWRLTGAILGRMQDGVKKQGGRFLLLTHPDTLIPRDLRFVTGSDFEADYRTPTGVFHYRAAQPVSELAAIAQTLGMDFINPNKEILDRIAKGRLEDQVWPNPAAPHYGPLGHEMVADVLDRLLPPLLEKDGSVR